MAETQDLLIEIGTEELPPKALSSLSAAFSSGICQGLDQHQLPYDTIISFATPRRLAVWIKQVITLQPQRSIERRGPAIAAAFDKQGQATKAAVGFARSCGVEVTDLEQVSTEKGSWLVHRSVQAGQSLSSLLPAIIEAALAGLPIPKRMRWADLPFEFGRSVFVMLEFLEVACHGNEGKGIVAEMAFEHGTTGNDSKVNVTTEFEGLDNFMVRIGMGIVSDRIIPDKGVSEDLRKLIFDTQEAFAQDLDGFAALLVSGL